MDFNSKTLFIIGAGASVKYGLPLGKDIIPNMETVLEQHPDITQDPLDINDFRFCKFLMREGYRLDYLNQIIENITATGSISVDDFFRHKEVVHGQVKPAKMLLTYVIKKTINSSIIRKNDWVEPLINYLMDEYKDQLLSGNVKFLSFNYDQILKEKIDYILKIKYGLQDSNFPYISHVYGKVNRGLGGPVGEYDQSFFEMVESDAYGISFVRNELPKTYNLIQEKIKEARNIVVMGYGFNRENNKILLGEHNSHLNYQSKKIVFTVLGQGEGSTLSLNETFGGNVSMYDTTCLDLVENVLKKRSYI